MLTLGNKIIAGSFKTGASWEVGDVGISAFGIDEALNKRRYLNGQVISQAQFVEFTAMLKSRVSVYPNLATTEANWQATVTNSDLGQCGQFVIDDDAGTIRLPKVVNIQGLMDLTSLGDLTEAGLPNIEGELTADRLAYNIDKHTGAFLKSNTNNTKYPASNASQSHNVGIVFDASDSNSIYGNSTTVQPEAVRYPYFIQVAEGVETSVDVSREIELNNPFSLLDYKYSEYELSNASWLLSNGQWNSGAVYQSVYELLLQELNGTSNKLPYRSYVNTVGNLVNTDGVLSGFSASNYAILPNTFNPESNTWEQVWKITTGNDVSSDLFFVIAPEPNDYNGCSFRVAEGKFRLSCGNSGTSWNIGNQYGTYAVQTNTTYWIKITFNGSSYVLSYSLDGINYTADATITSSAIVTPTKIKIGQAAVPLYPFNGSVDLNESYININDSRWWTGRRKIVTTLEDYTDEDYRLNTSDTTFRLPIKVLMAGSKRVAGNGMTLGLTNGTDTVGLEQQTATLAYLNTSGYGFNISSSTAPGGSNPDGSFGITTDETKSGIETSANGLYLYFYVGETIQDANIIAAASVLTDVADLKNASNFSSLGKNTIVGWGMPDFSAGITVNATSYTAPKDGIVLINCVHIDNNSNNASINGVQVYNFSMSGSYANGTMTPFETPVSAGDVITSNRNILKFYPYKGA